MTAYEACTSKPVSGLAEHRPNPDPVRHRMTLRQLDRTHQENHRSVCRTLRDLVLDRIRQSVDSSGRAASRGQARQDPGPKVSRDWLKRSSNRRRPVPFSIAPRLAERIL